MKETVYRLRLKIAFMGNIIKAILLKFFDLIKLRNVFEMTLLASFVMLLLASNHLSSIDNELPNQQKGKPSSSTIFGFVYYTTRSISTLLIKTKRLILYQKYTPPTKEIPTPTNIPQPTDNDAYIENTPSPQATYINEDIIKTDFTSSSDHGFSDQSSSESPTTTNFYPTSYTESFTHSDTFNGFLTSSLTHINQPSSVYTENPTFSETLNPPNFEESFTKESNPFSYTEFDSTPPYAAFSSTSTPTQTFESTPTPTPTPEPTPTPTPTPTPSFVFTPQIIENAEPISSDAINNQLNAIKKKLNDHKKESLNLLLSISKNFDDMLYTRESEVETYLDYIDDDDGRRSNKPSFMTKFYDQFINTSPPKGSNGMWEAKGETPEFTFHSLSTSIVNKIAFDHVPIDQCTMRDFYIKIGIGEDPDIVSKQFTLKQNMARRQNFSLPFAVKFNTITLKVLNNYGNISHVCIPEFRVFQHVGFHS